MDDMIMYRMEERVMDMRRHMWARLDSPSNKTRALLGWCDAVLEPLHGLGVAYLYPTTETVRNSITHLLHTVFLKDEFQRWRTITR